MKGNVVDINFSIRVVDEDGDGVEGCDVFVSYPWTNDKDTTDGDGWVHFEKDTSPWRGIETTIYVGGEVQAEDIWIEDGDSFSYVV